ncbi:hypothetical protein MYX82_08480 [Acidobacteria bacterium AH-259-D05]|nr:hypothetical protein [Acidobacteria bacterium AH-259-D05]
MRKIELLDFNHEILQRVMRIEDALQQDGFQFFNNALKAYKDSCLKETQISKRQILVNQYIKKCQLDKDLSYPHTKILNALLDQYNFSEHRFKEIHFSRLVREARLGKNKAKGYLSLLEQKGYIEKRNDGYRKFFKVRPHTFLNEKTF